MSAGRPVPTGLAVVLISLALVPAALAVAGDVFLWLALALDGAVLALCVGDFLAAPRASDVVVRRDVEPVLSSGVAQTVRLVVESRGARPVRGRVRDEVPSGIEVRGHEQPFSLSPEAPSITLPYSLTPLTRGDLRLGDVHLRLLGPLGLCARQVQVSAAQSVKVYPDLTALSREALALTLASDAPAERLLRRSAEGREFESLREYRPGDDYRSVDWKATARRGRTTVRVYQPERNQPVLLMLDCGRHMAGRVEGRRKLDHAVDAALRLAKVSLDAGDLVGVLAFASDVRASLPPRKGHEHLRLITESLYRAEAALEESDYGRAYDFAFARSSRRSLVVLFTDLVDPDASGTLLSRTLALRPRHLPVVASLLDEDLQTAATAIPDSVPDAYARQAAARLEEDYQRTALTLRDSGALVVRASAKGFGAAAVNTYLHVKARGLL
ncbi:cell division protein DivIC (FtsB), stabilizes FtsL against RasP cleavage [Cystobacter fuscus]|uniref:Cell division protein DivIC (FtsB), stabilizes FtsL against RasP cleavage n=1 Tax=Cystobacter fuscus TaxID=43 RepID=A0A250J9P1_9BACT|nr:DUF58 domain-containing protein [Cystobacter fuscus]ATB40625.1 cell division protein DivIC (FtsB), stabilizes FtsL against RasP cleavage [Cystobacter fuscus]